MSGVSYVATLPDIFIWLGELGSGLFSAVQDSLQAYKDFEEVIKWMRERRDLLVRQLASLRILHRTKSETQRNALLKRQPSHSLKLISKRWLRPQSRAPPFLEFCKPDRLQTCHFIGIMDVYE